ncbi:MAG: CpsD/CapB family tyrosine-protein kinase [Syntrophomonadaceae bacterium]|nr:CpsD/CapB family tyrosine-protein kinase [Syntrophomonadaceae bacterium]
MAKEVLELTALDKPKSIVAEAYRTLRTNLGFAGIDNPFRSILISSPSPQDGKSTITANLGVVLAQAGSKVIIVDCDLRKPMQHKIFATENLKGLTNCLLKEMPVEEAAHSTPVKGLTLLTSGAIPPNPAEILNSQRVRSFWPTLLQEYDYVLVDAPPVLAVTDASILSAQMEGVIMVVRAAVTRKEQVMIARDQFAKANANLIGVVLNQVDTDNDDYGYYYYYYTPEEAPHSSIRTI